MALIPTGGTAPGVGSVVMAARVARVGCADPCPAVAFPCRPVAVALMAVSTFHDVSDPFVLADKALQRLLQILAAHRQRPLLRRWIDQPYGEEEITLLEEEVIPALMRLRERVEEIDAELQHAYDRGYEDRQLDIEERQVEIEERRYAFRL
jgi:hypothetical protein